MLIWQQNCIDPHIDAFWLMADGWTKSNEKMRHSATPSLLSFTSAVYTTWASRPARFAAAMNALQAAGSKFQVTCSEFRSHQTRLFPAAWLDIKVLPCWKDLTTNWRQNSWLCVEVLKNWEQVGSVGSVGKIRKAQGAAASTSFFRRDTHIRARLPHARAVANSAS